MTRWRRLPLRSSVSNLALAISLAGCVLSALCFVGCGETSPSTPGSSCVAPQLAEEKWKEELIFQSGFEDKTTLKKLSEKRDTLVGKDLSLDTRSDWERDLQGHPNVGKMNLFYEGGTDQQRRVSLTRDPDDPTNQILLGQLFSPNVGGSKGRIQMDINGLTGLKAFRFQFRIRLQDGFQSLSTFSGLIHWMTLAEFWNNLPGESFPFRVTLNLLKEKGDEKAVYWGSHGQTKEGFGWKDVWNKKNKTVPVPLREWFTLELLLAEGCGNAGRWKVTLLTKEGKRFTIFDERVDTRHPRDAKSDGFSAINPLKIYTNKEMIEFARKQQQVLTIGWDDLRFWKLLPPSP